MKGFPKATSLQDSNTIPQIARGPTNLRLCTLLTIAYGARSLSGEETLRTFSGIRQHHTWGSNPSPCKLRPWSTHSH